ncbi:MULTISPECIES: LysM peptidoglycan-binding domain-containing protein [unclassified Streptomyces]|uniref:LysM peptidoglycan-binding domain-containing protein n=1 Tax=unclassified Streptomyces TaxID=2593676 RepID=UPI00203606AF|nr:MULTISPECIES: LysM domain-containing protein [unclassified Streptomyces]
MGLFDFLKSDKKKAREQVEQQRPVGSPPPAAGTPSSMGGKYTDAAEATRAAAERMSAAAPPKPAAPPHTPTPGSAAHKAVPAAPAPKPAPAAKKRTYTVKPGDSLSAIARRELGNEGRWRELYAMNKGVVGTNPDLIRPGMVLTLPN